MKHGVSSVDKFIVVDMYFVHWRGFRASLQTPGFGNKFIIFDMLSRALKGLSSINSNAKKLSK